ncbi:hypothetical protein FI667_g5042, partial [Globisporangium splendens]
MDVPSWHPANQDAARRLLASASTAATKRTEFKVMPGSSADTTTEAGRQFVNDLSGGSSGALYLLEQKRIEEEQKNKRRAEEEASLKLQAQKPSLLPLDAVGAASRTSTSDSVVTMKRAASGASIDGKKAPAAAIVTVKAKKRKAPASDESKSAESSTIKKKQKPGKTSTQADTKDAPKMTADANSAATSPPPPPPPAPAKKAAPAPGALLLGYSSSSDDDGSDKD